VARAFKSCVGDGIGVRVIVGVEVEGSVRVGARVDVEVAWTVAITEAGSGGV